jgi:signal transduction histidine kinase
LPAAASASRHLPMPVAEKLGGRAFRASENLAMFRIIKLILIITIGSFAVAAVYISLTVVERQKALREVSRYNLTWVATQAVNETLRFELQISDLAGNANTKDLDEVRTRLDILYNRLGVLKEGMISAYIERNPEPAEVINELDSALHQIESVTDRITEPNTIRYILSLLKPLESRLSRFAASTNRFSAEQVAADQRELLRLHWTFSVLAGGLFLCGLAFIALLFAQNRLIRDGNETLRAMTEELRQAKNRAEAASEAKSHFLANMSHELRTPLNAIIGFGEIISDEAVGPVGQSRYREYATDIVRSGQHMYEMITDILTMAQLEAGSVEISFDIVELDSIVQSAIAMVHGTSQAKGRKVSTDGFDEKMRLRADQRSLKQMLLNLLSNALKFSDPDRTVDLKSRHLPDGSFALTVIDHGIGMTAEEATIAVQPFQQIDSGLARRYDGTGLGLAIVKGLIERHGGRLTIESEPRVGSQISLIFPSNLVIAEGARLIAQAVN